MSAPDIVVSLKTVIRNLRKIDLRVIATVCDQGATNCSAITTLKKDTEREHEQAGIENRMFGFSVDGEEVIPLFDVPHLLKAVRNNLLAKDCAFQWKGSKPQKASWKHIVQLYELDRGDSDTRALNKLSDYHVYGNVMKKMKVSCAAQVFSHRVSSTMRLLARCCTCSF